MLPGADAQVNRAALRLSFRLIQPRSAPSTPVHATDGKAGTNKVERP